MRAIDVLNDYSSRHPPREEPKHLQAISDAIRASGSDTAKLMEMMAAISKALSEKKYSIEAPKVNVNFDMESLISAIQAIKMPEYQAPRVEVNNAELIAAIREDSTNKDAASYEFHVKRGNDGRIVSVIASPL